MTSALVHGNEHATAAKARDRPQDDENSTIPYSISCEAKPHRTNPTILAPEYSKETDFLAQALCLRKMARIDFIQTGRHVTRHLMVAQLGRRAVYHAQDARTTFSKS